MPMELRFQITNLLISLDDIVKESMASGKTREKFVVELYELEKNARIGF